MVSRAAADYGVLGRRGPAWPADGQGEQRSMNAFWGADTEALRRMGTVCTRRADALADLEHLLSSAIENTEWSGEDADRFRADWGRIVRTGLQDQEVELRHRARRLTQHADEQDAVSAPDAPLLGGGGGIGGGGGSGGGAEGAVGPGGRGGPLADLLRTALSTPEGRTAFLGSFLGSLMGGLLADMIARGAGLGMALENLLTGLGLGGGLSNLLGESTLLPAEAHASPASVGSGPDGATGENPSGAGGSAEVGAASDAGTATDAGAASGGAAGAGGSGAASSGGAATGADAAGGETAGAEAGSGAGSEASGSGDHSGLRGTEAGPGRTAGSSPSGRIEASEDQGSRSVLERLLEMLGDALGGGTPPGCPHAGTGSPPGGPHAGTGSAIGAGIGASALGGSSR